MDDKNRDKNYNKEQVSATDSLVNMFVGMVQKGRIEKGQCPALRPVFLKPHGVAQGRFIVRSDIPKHLAKGLFSGKEYPLWARFSSDTLPSVSDYKTTCGIGLKLFNTPTPKIFGLKDDVTFDFIMQNHPVFFVDTAKDMCEFTRAGVINHDYDSYLNAHPKTAKILDEMAKPVGSVLASPYWGILPFSLGKKQQVKYMLKPKLKVALPSTPPSDPTYLAQEMAQRLSQQEVCFEFCVQLRTNPKTMPLDAATVEWPESESPFIAIADIIFPQQDIHARGQAEYGENLSMNIWRVTEEHIPHGSIAEARREVYAASAEQRRHINGIPDGEPITPMPSEQQPQGKDTNIVRAAIHPGIGVARVGNAETEFYIGPEVTHPNAAETGFYRTPQGSLKRQAARFRIYGYNAAGEVVSELTSGNANIRWQVQVANTKANWFHFITAMDIPESKDLIVQRRNPKILGAQRKALAITPDPISISGASESGKQYRFDTGRFKDESVYLGELQTDDNGRLIFLGGHGVSKSPSGKPPYDEKDGDSFNNAADWYDDMSDGPVNANVSINGVEIPVEGAWVISAPPNFAPNIIGWRTMYDLMTDVFVKNGWLPVPERTSFTQDVLPQLQRLSNLQWVNKGFAAMFGAGGQMNFEDPNFVERLAQKPSGSGSDVLDPYAELRRAMLNSFRPYQTKVNEPRLWPWLYGDDFGGDLFQASPNTMLALPSLQQLHLQRWAAGDFENDWDPDYQPASQLDQLPLQEQPAMLDKAAMHFCLADAFHPGCEMTWPMRHASMYSAPYRIRQSPKEEAIDQWGTQLSQADALAINGPLYAQVAGGITRWMGLPWQGDTAYCRAGYDPDYDLYQPSFWPARVPNTILSEEDYKVVMDLERPKAERIAAFYKRQSWNRFIDRPKEDGDKPKIAQVMERMIAEFAEQGIIEARAGFADDPDFPEVIYVENNGYVEHTHALLKAIMEPEKGSREDKLRSAGWASEEQHRDAVRLRQRKPTNR